MHCPAKTVPALRSSSEHTPEARSQAARGPAMNSFERHGITRLSPSSLNYYLASPAHWVMQRLLNLRRRERRRCSWQRG